MSIVIKRQKKSVPICSLPIGSTGIVVEQAYYGHLLLVAYNGIVSLTDPSQTWEKNCPLRVSPCDCELIVK